MLQRQGVARKRWTNRRKQLQLQQVRPRLLPFSALDRLRKGLTHRNHQILTRLGLGCLGRDATGRGGVTAADNKRPYYRDLRVFLYMYFVIPLLYTHNPFHRSPLSGCLLLSKWDALLILARLLATCQIILSSECSSLMQLSVTRALQSSFHVVSDNMPCAVNKSPNRPGLTQPEVRLPLVTHHSSVFKSAFFIGQHASKDSYHQCAICFPRQSGSQ